jgi:hypothetical protein
MEDCTLLVGSAHVFNLLTSNSLTCTARLEEKCVRSNIISLNTGSPVIHGAKELAALCESQIAGLGIKRNGEGAIRGRHANLTANIMLNSKLVTGKCLAAITTLRIESLLIGVILRHTYTVFIHVSEVTTGNRLALFTCTLEHHRRV